MKSVILTALVLCLILCGCAEFASDRYYFVTPHTEQTVQPENADITVVTFAQLRQALKDMIQEGVESRVVYVPNYNLSRLEEDCRRVVATGVSEVMSFDEQQVVMDTDHGVLTVEGNGLHVEKLSLDIGEVAIAGTVNALYYARRKQSKGSLWSKLF